LPLRLDDIRLQFGRSNYSSATAPDPISSQQWSSRKAARENASCSGI